MDGSDGWHAINPSPREPRSVVDVEVGKTPYRALVLRRLPVVDPEAEPTPASPAITLLYAAPIAPVKAHIWCVEVQAIEACLALLAAATLISAWALTQGLRTLCDLASYAEKIDVGRWMLSERVESRRFSELRPLADSLTELVDRLHVAFDRERQFFGDATHEMKSWLPSFVRRFNSHCRRIEAQSHIGRSCRTPSQTPNVFRI